MAVNARAGVGLRRGSRATTARRLRRNASSVPIRHRPRETGESSCPPRSTFTWVVACAAVADDKGLRLGIAGVDDRPRVFPLPSLDDDQFDDALNDIAWSLNARDDIHASARYRRELVRTTTLDLPRAPAAAMAAATAAR